MENQSSKTYKQELTKEKEVPLTDQLYTLKLGIQEIMVNYQIQIEKNLVEKFEAILSLNSKPKTKAEIKENLKLNKREKKEKEAKRNKIKEIIYALIIFLSPVLAYLT